MFDYNCCVNKMSTKFGLVSEELCSSKEQGKNRKSYNAPCLSNLKRGVTMRVIPNVPIIYKNKFPRNFVNDVNGWAFSKKELKDNLGRLLTLDIDFGNFCTLN